MRIGGPRLACKPRVQLESKRFRCKWIPNKDEQYHELFNTSQSSSRKIEPLRLAEVMQQHTHEAFKVNSEPQSTSRESLEEASGTGQYRHTRTRRNLNSLDERSTLLHTTIKNTSAEATAHAAGFGSDRLRWPHAALRTLERIHPNRAAAHECSAAQRHISEQKQLRLPSHLVWLQNILVF